MERQHNLTSLRAGIVPERRMISIRLVHLFTSATIIGLWLRLYRPVFDYLAIIFSRDDFRTNQIILLGIVVLIVIRMRKDFVRPRLDLLPQLHLPALALTLVSSALYLLLERFIDINTLSASFFGLASYGLLGLWMDPRRWREGLPASLLLIGTLPFGEHMQTFIGYPMRLLTAAVVRDGLSVAGIASVGVDTILMFENGVSHIDLPCSGVKSLWAGALFLIGATWIERHRLNLRWLLTLAAFGLLLFVSNLIRVAVLTVVGQVAGWHVLAQMLHVPLGVMGFVAACSAAVALLRLQPRLSPVQAGQPNALARPMWLAPLLAAAILGMALLYSPRPQTVLAQPDPSWKLPADLASEPLPLEPEEIEWLRRDGAESASRFRFAWQGDEETISGSMILIASTTWRAHHNPERCLMLYGLSLDDSRTHLVKSDFPVRYISLGANQGGGRSLHTGAYWFQSARRTTDDYATRIWADTSLKRDHWILVTILFDNVYDARHPDVEAFTNALHAAVARNLDQGE